VSQKRQKEAQTSVPSKKHKPNRKSLGVPPKKNRKTGKRSCRCKNRWRPACFFFYFKSQQHFLSAVEFSTNEILPDHCSFFPTLAVSSPPANSSDSEDQSVVEGTAKSTASKNSPPQVKAATSPKCHVRSPPSSHKYHKQGDADHSQHRDNHGRSSRVYKWSFQMGKCRTI